jgi:hypothetical protein
MLRFALAFYGTTCLWTDKYFGTQSIDTSFTILFWIARHVHSVHRYSLHSYLFSPWTFFSFFSGNLVRIAIRISLLCPYLPSCLLSYMLTMPCGHFVPLDILRHYVPWVRYLFRSPFCLSYMLTMPCGHFVPLGKLRHKCLRTDCRDGDVVSFIYNFIWYSN